MVSIQENRLEVNYRSPKNLTIRHNHLWYDKSMTNSTNTKSDKRYEKVSAITKARWEKYRKENPYVKVRNKSMGKTFTLDITKDELEDYRKKQLVCEMCGKEETCITFTGSTGRKTPNKLAVDHNYETGKFRGLLCRRCNCQFGWYEKHRKMVEAYIEAKSNV